MKKQGSIPTLVCVLCLAALGCGGLSPSAGDDTGSETADSSGTGSEPPSDTGGDTADTADTDTQTTDTGSASQTGSAPDTETADSDTADLPPICQGIIPDLEFGVMAAGATKNGQSNWSTDGCFATEPTAEGPEEVWRLEVNEPSEISLTAQVTDSDYDLVLKVLSECTTATGNKLACDDNATSGAAEQINTALDEGTYFVVVDGWKAEDFGAYSLSATRSALPDGAACFAPLTAAMGFQTGNTEDASLNYAATCDPSGVNSGKDQVWRFTATESTWIEATMNTVGVASGFACQLSARTSCSVKSSDKACDNDTNTDGDFLCKVKFEVEAGESYYLLAGKHRQITTGGEYALMLAKTTAPATGNECDGTPSDCSDIAASSGEQAAGCCQDDKLYRCDEPFTLSSTNCAAQGLTCGLDTDDDAVACL